MSKAAKTKQFIIEKTAPFFNIHGFEGTSLSVLQQATGLTKGSIYGNFRDKEEIALEAFKFSMERVRAIMTERMDKEKSAKGKLISLVSFFSEYVFDPPIPGGCPLLNNAVEADDSHVTMKKEVAKEIQRTISFIASLVDLGKKNNEFRKDVKSKEVAYVLFSSVEGALMISRVSADDTAMRVVVKNCKNILAQISI
jgi:AcrR family transcriptional regulator